MLEKNAEPSMETPTSFTCITCHVAFKSPDLQRQHYKTDWHRYNLKRKVAELPPVTADDFQNKVLTQRKLELQQPTPTVYCQACSKSFGNQNAFDNHLNSKKHKENEKHHLAPEPQDSHDDEVEEVDSDEWDEDTENPIDRNDCLFCPHHSRSFLRNLDHMTTAHSFFIPDIEFCVDVQGLLRYLGEKVSDGFMCLWCNERGRTFHSAEAAQQHMVDKGHCRMLHEGLALAEYADFYDYSASYPDHELQQDKEEEVTVPELDGSEYQLVLPSGVTVGHRSLMRYYKQSMNPNPVVASSNTKRLHKVLATYRALGWSETQQEAAAKKARDLHYMKRMQAKLNLSVGVKANKLQKHFRPQVNF